MNVTAIAFYITVIFSTVAAAINFETAPVMVPAILATVIGFSAWKTYTGLKGKSFEEGCKILGLPSDLV